MTTALERLQGGYYNSEPVSEANPGGFADGGHVVNFPAALADFSTTTAALTGLSATIETGEPGSEASITLSGDEGAPVLDFVIPRGDQGFQGLPGPDTVDAFMALGPVVARGDLYGLDTLPSTLGFALSGSERAFGEGYYRDGPVVEDAFPALAGDIFTRSSGGTARATDGSLLAYGAGVPRIVPGRGLLVEPAATNLLGHGERPDDTRYWYHDAGALFTAGGVWNGVQYILSASACGPGLCSVGIDIVRGTATQVQLTLVAVPSDARARALVNLVTGEIIALIGALAGKVFAREAVPGGHRLNLSAITPAGTDNVLLVLEQANGTLTPSRAQLNAGIPTSHIPTAPAATNLIVDSDMVLGPGDVLVGPITQSVISAAGPTGQTMVRRLQVDAVGTIRLNPNYAGAVAGALYSGSIYVRTRDGGSRVVGVDTNDSGNVDHLATGLWQRFSQSGTNATAPSLWIDLTLPPGDYEVSAMQIEAGPIVTAYIPTTTAAVTRAALNPVRAADVATAGIEIGASGTLVVEFVVPPVTGGTQTLIGQVGGAFANIPLSVYYNQLSTISGGVGLTVVLPTPGTVVRGAVTWEPGRRALTVTDVAVQSDTWPLEQVPVVQIGAFSAGFQLNSSISRVTAFPYALSDAELQALTVIPA